MEERGKCVVCIGEKSCDSLLKLQRLFRRGEGGGGGSANSRFLSHVGGGGTFSNPFHSMCSLLWVMWKREGDELGAKGNVMNRSSSNRINKPLEPFLLALSACFEEEGVYFLSHVGWSCGREASALFA